MFQESCNLWILIKLCQEYNKQRFKLFKEVHYAMVIMSPLTESFTIVSAVT